jgi:hypothetical protein
MPGDVHDRSHAAISIHAKSPATIPMLIGGTWRAPTELRFRPFHRDATHTLESLEPYFEKPGKVKYQS